MQSKKRTVNRHHYAWWNYMKYAASRYPKRLQCKDLSRIERAEQEAVQAAINATIHLPDGEMRMRLIQKVLLQCTHKISAAASEVPCSERTAFRWQFDFICEMARNFKCDSLL